MKTTSGKVKAYALVRDKNGKPKINNIYGIPQPLWELLTNNEKQEVLINGGYTLSSNP